MNIFKKLFTKKISNPLEVYYKFKIDFCCPNSGPWNCLHAIYRLRPIENLKEEVWIAFPRQNNLWNYMSQCHNMGLIFELPFPPTHFRVKEFYYKPAKKDIRLYVLDTLE